MKGREELEIVGRSITIPNYSIDEIDLNTEKSPGDLKRLAVSQTPVKDHRQTLVLLKPSLGLFRFVGRRRVLLPHPGSATGHLIAPGDHHTLQHIQVHIGVEFQADFEDVRWHDVALT